MLKDLKAFLNQPYPDRDDIPSMIQGAVIGGLVAILHFRPPNRPRTMVESL